MDVPAGRNGNMSDDFDIISRYSRADAIEDGALVDVTVTAKEAGIKLPTALTREVWETYVALSPAASKACNDERGGLWDILWMFHAAPPRVRAARASLRFEASTSSRFPGREAVACDSHSDLRTGRRRRARHHDPAPRAGLKENDMNKDILRRPFDPGQIRTRPGQNGKQVSYVDVAAVITRLNEGCDVMELRRRVVQDPPGRGHRARQAHGGRRDQDALWRKRDHVGSRGARHLGGRRSEGRGLGRAQEMRVALRRRPRDVRGLACEGKSPDVQKIDVQTGRRRRTASRRVSSPRFKPPPDARAGRATTSPSWSTSGSARTTRRRSRDPKLRLSSASLTAANGH